MNRLPIFLFLAALFIGLVPSSGDALETCCYGREGMNCHCCAASGTLVGQEAFSPCLCPGPDNPLPATADLLMAQNALETNLPAIGGFDSSQPVPRNFIGTTPQKPPPFLI